MSYFSKEAELRAYKTLSSMSEDPTTQGATQKISALRYAIALDMFYHQYGRPCNTQDNKDKGEFVRFVGQVVSVDTTRHTTNFFTPLAYSNGDCNVGSNFYSVNAVKESLINKGEVVVFPKRGGHPLMDIQRGSLIQNTNYYKNLDYYFDNSSIFKTALIVWLLRTVDYNYTDYQSVRNALLSFCTPELIRVLIPISFQAEVKPYLQFQKNKPDISSNDIDSLFSRITNPIKQNSPSLPLQQIYFGAPGTGKSHAVKEKTDAYRSTTIRTTFHPDSDYASFVGCYKPSMRSVKQTYINEGEQKPVLNAQKEQVCKDEIVYAYTPQAFLQAYTLAWQRLQDNTPVFLIIEEINRGNCAQIFGDLFQLLDRNKDGYSEYTIHADRDMQDYLCQTLGDYAALPATIASGEELQLPPNLHIWATMNTSDQSLFPIDSAFKRRWQWKYCPITDANLGYQIVVGDKKYNWWKVISYINQEIENVTKSEDKKLGYFFVQADHDNIILEETFVNKVVFYLWNDVFRDAYDNSLFADGLTFYRFFLPNGDTDTAVLQQFLSRIPDSECH